MGKKNCPICGKNTYQKILQSRDYRYELTTQKFQLVQCLGCGLIYLNPRLLKSQINKFYPEKYYDSKFSFLEKAVNNFFLISDSRILRKIKKTGRLLDLGCGKGDFLLSMKNLGYQVVGIDISQSACRLAKEKGLTVYCGELNSHQFPDKYFDVITLWHVFEHLYDPVKTLREIGRVLKDDGVLVIETPNIASLSFKIFREYCFHLDLPRHVYHWSDETMTRILEKNGFEVFGREQFSLGFPLSFFQSTKNFLRSKGLKSPFLELGLLVGSPLLFVSTFISRIWPGKGEILKVYSRKTS